MCNVERQKILWIEDDYFLLKDLHTELEENGFEVVPVCSYQEAEEKLQDWKEYSLVLLDLILPYSQNGDVNPNSMLQSSNKTVSESTVALAENGLSLIDLMSSKEGFDIPIIIMSVTVSNETIGKILKSKRLVKLVSKLNSLPGEVCETIQDVLEKENLK